MDRRQNNPFRGIVDVMSEMTRMRELGKTGHETGYEDRQRTHATAWVPSANIFTRGSDLMIQLSLSGVRREDVDITFSNNVLSIAGERMGEPDEEDVNFYVRELYYGAFRRNITLPEGVDEGKISADFGDGLMEITVRDGAVAAAEPSRIEIGERTGSREIGSRE